MKGILALLIYLDFHLKFICNSRERSFCLFIFFYIILFKVNHDLKNRIPTNEQLVANMCSQIEQLQKYAPFECSYFIYILQSFISLGKIGIADSTYLADWRRLMLPKWRAPSENSRNASRLQTVPPSFHFLGLQALRPSSISSFDCTVYKYLTSLNFVA